MRSERTTVCSGSGELQLVTLIKITQWAAPPLILQLCLPHGLEKASSLFGEHNPFP